MVTYFLKKKSSPVIHTLITCDSVKSLPNTPPNIRPHVNWNVKSNCASLCGLMVISSQVTWAPFLNRMSSRICGCGCSCSQSYTWCDLLPRQGFLFKSDRARNCYGAVPVCATGVILEIRIFVRGLQWTAARTLISVLLFTLCIHTYKEPIFLKVLFTSVFVVQCGILWDVCWHLLHF